MTSPCRPGSATPAARESVLDRVPRVVGRVGDIELRRVCGAGPGNLSRPTRRSSKRERKPVVGLLAVDPPLHQVPTGHPEVEHLAAKGMPTGTDPTRCSRGRRTGSPARHLQTGPDTSSRRPHHDSVTGCTVTGRDLHDAASKLTADRATPWIVWLLNQARRTSHKRRRWFVAAGVLRAAHQQRSLPATELLPTTYMLLPPPMPLTGGPPWIDLHRVSPVGSAASPGRA